MMTLDFIKPSSWIVHNAQMTLKRPPLPEKFNTMNRRNILVQLLIGGSIVLLSPAAHAKRRRRGRHGKRQRYRYGDDYEHDRARESVETGRAVPLSKVVLEIKKVIPGDIVEVEFDDKSDPPLYKLTILSVSGSYFDVIVEAHTGTILTMKKR